MKHTTQADKARHLWHLHDDGCFVLPNVWDFASAALVLDAGFDVVATSSAAVAFARGWPDGERIGRDTMIAIAGELAARLDAPVTADLEAGYGRRPEDVAATVAAAIGAGVVGCNIEDASPHGQLLELELATARIRAGVDAARSSGLPEFSLNARTDPFLCGGRSGPEQLAESVLRGKAYLAAGARSVFVPGTVDPAVIGELVAGIGGPVNVMAVGGGATPDVERLRGLGVRRVSL